MKRMVGFGGLTEWNSLPNKCIQNLSDHFTSQNMRNIPKLIFLFIIAACGQTDSDKLNSGIKVIYVETINFRTDIQTCFSGNLFSRWSDSLFELHENGIYYSDLKGKHLFLGINSFNQENARGNVEKMRITLIGNLTIANTTYSIEKFVLQDNGEWKAITGLKNYKTFDRRNDFISPGRLDVDEICEQLVQETVEASYK